MAEINIESKLNNSPKSTVALKADTAAQCHKKLIRYTNTRTNKVMNKTFREGY